MNNVNAEISDLPFKVKDMVFGYVIRGRSDINAKLRLHLDEGAENDINALIPLSDPIAATQLNMALPTTLKGTQTGSTFPYVRGVIGVEDQGGTTERWIDLILYAGGKPY